MNNIIPYLTLAACLFLQFSCKTSETVRIPPAIHENIPVAVAAEAPKPSAPMEDDLINHIKITMPKLEKGMKRDHVCALLLLNSRFKGIVTSDGSAQEFNYYYDIKGYQLFLSFDYLQHKSGALSKWNFEHM